MNEDLTQPFWVGWNNPRFSGARYGYLPPLLQPEEEVPPIELQQLKARLIYLEGKVHSYTDKKRSNYIYSSIIEDDTVDETPTS